MIPKHSVFTEYFDEYQITANDLFSFQNLKCRMFRPWTTKDWFLNLALGFKDLSRTGFRKTENRQLGKMSFPKPVLGKSYKTSLGTSPSFFSKDKIVKILS